MDERADAGDDERHQQAQAVDAVGEVDGQAAGLDPREVAHDLGLAAVAEEEADGEGEGERDGARPDGRHEAFAAAQRGHEEAHDAVHDGPGEREQQHELERAFGRHSEVGGRKRGSSGEVGSGRLRT